MNEKYIIEARDKHGQLLLADYPQPAEHKAFGIKALTGITTGEMAKVIYASNPEALLVGGDVPNWPRFINKNWIARKKTW